MNDQDEGQQDQQEALGMFMSGLRFPPPKSFDGKYSKFEIFAFKLKAYLCLNNSRFRDLMRASEEATDSAKFDLLDADEQLLAILLQSALITLCEGVASRIAQRNQEGQNGFESWRPLSQRYGPTQRTQDLSRMQKILNRKFRSTYQHFENDFNEWEIEIQKVDLEPIKCLSREHHVWH